MKEKIKGFVKNHKKEIVITGVSLGAGFVLGRRFDILMEHRREIVVANEDVADYILEALRNYPGTGGAE